VVCRPIILCDATGVRGREDQELCLYLGAEVGLDMAAITVAAVAEARQGDNVDMVNMQHKYFFVLSLLKRP
jgi:hypothetical protein